MFILVRQSDKIIIGTATKMVDEKNAAEKGFEIFEIPDSEFNPELLGSKLKGFDKE